jgi:hypothetical protein
VRLEYPGRVLFVDDDARSNEYPVHAVEFGTEPFDFLSVWTKGQIPPFRETDHDPETYHRGDEKLSWVDEHYKDRTVRVLGYKQHFHIRGHDVTEFVPFISPGLNAEIAGRNG